MEGSIIVLIAYFLTGSSADIPVHRISARSAKSFLLDQEAKQNCPDTSKERYCESHKAECNLYNDNLRITKCIKNPCLPGQACVFENPCPVHGLPVKCIADPCATHRCNNGGTCDLAFHDPYCLCPPGYHGDDCSITPCHSFTCLNGGTCNNIGSKAVCACQPGFIYDDCSYAPCASYVCYNGGTCKVVGDQAACDCTPGYETDVCKLDCRPGPVDVVFVIDGSISQTNGKNKSLDFVRRFINKVPVGIKDFQFAVITYSTDATVIFDLNDFNTTSEIESALKVIRFSKGATYTSKGLSKAGQILSESSSGVRMTVASKYIILLTDGLSTDRRNAINYAKTWISDGHRIMTIGLGNQVDHSEILQLATNLSYVYSPERDDAFNRLMLETSDPDCKNCSETSKTDVFILLDTSSANQTQSQYHATVNVVKALVRELNVENSEVHVGLAKFDDDVDSVFYLGDTLDTDVMLSRVVTVSRSKGASESNATNSLRYAENKAFKPENGGRIDSRQIVVLFSNGHWKDVNATKIEIMKLFKNEIKVFIVGTGRDANIKNLFEVATSAFNVIYVDNSENEDNVKSIVSETRYVNCDDDLFD